RGEILGLANLKVFHIEKRLEYSSASEKAAQRRRHLKAMIDDFYQLIEEAGLPDVQAWRAAIA
ncbi:hypothetical protein ACLUXQ_09385, partial [Limosilactobacillus mucosae]